MSQQNEFHRCKLCYYRTRSLHIILHHVRLHRRRSKTYQFICSSNAVEPYECDECDECDFKTELKVTLKSHKYVTHADKQGVTSIEHSCTNCTFKTYSSLVLLKHSNKCTHTEVEPTPRNNRSKWFQCEECSFQSKNKGNLLRHIKGKHSNENNWFQCNQCSYKFNTKHKLLTHVQRWHGWKVLEGLNCTQCTYKFASKWRLLVHIKQCHQDVVELQKVDQEWFKCDQCPYKSKFKGAVDNHAITCRELFSCEICKYVTRNKNYFRRHVVGTHGNPEDSKWLRCEQCKYKTVHKYRLNAHVRTEHSGILVCPKCPYTSKFQQNMSLHVKHTHQERQQNGKRFACELCSFTTEHTYLLKNHKIVAHSGSNQGKWFECEKCFYKTKYSQNLTRHILEKH